MVKKALHIIENMDCPGGWLAAPCAEIVDILDELDGDADFEPSLGSLCDGLSWRGQVDQSNWASGTCDDCEEEDDDLGFDADSEETIDDCPRHAHWSNFDVSMAEIRRMADQWRHEHLGTPLPKQGPQLVYLFGRPVTEWPSDMVNWGTPK